MFRYQVLWVFISHNGSRFCGECFFVGRRVAWEEGIIEKSADIPLSGVIGPNSRDATRVWAGNKKAFRALLRAPGLGTAAATG